MGGFDDALLFRLGLRAVDGHDVCFYGVRVYRETDSTRIEKECWLGTDKEVVSGSSNDVSGPGRLRDRGVTAISSQQFGSYGLVNNGGKKLTESE